MSAKSEVTVKKEKVSLKGKAEKLLQFVRGPAFLLSNSRTLIAANKDWRDLIFETDDLPTINITNHIDGTAWDSLSAFCIDSIDGEDCTIKDALLTNHSGLRYLTDLKCLAGRRSVLVQAEILIDRQQDLFLSFSDGSVTNMMLEAIPVPVFCKNTQHMYTACNEEFLKFNGFIREEIIGKSVFDVVPEESAEIFRKADDELFASRGKQVYDAILENAEGQKRNIVFHKSVMCNAKNEAIGIVGIILDVTEQRRIEDSLQDSQEMFNAIVENSPAHIFVKDLNGVYIIASEKLSDIFSWPKGYVTGKTNFDLFPEETAIQFTSADEKVMRTNQPTTERNSIKYDDLEITHLTVKFPLHDANGNLTGIVGIATDITDLTAAEQKLKNAATDLEQQIAERTKELSEEIKVREQAEKEIHEILSISPISVGIANFETGEITMENESLRKILAPDTDSLLGTNVSLLWANEIERRQYLADLNEKNYSEIPEVTLQRTTGETFPAKVFGRNIKRDGNIFSVFWIVDLTEMKEAQNQIQTSENDLRNMLSASPVAVGISEVETGKISFVNNSLVKLLGVSAKELLSNATLQFWQHSDDRTAFLEEFKREGKVTPRELQILRGNGDPVWVLLSWTKLKIENQDKIAFWLSDISQIKEAEQTLKASHETLERHVALRTKELKAEIAERKKIEIALRKSEELFEASANSTSDWFWGTDENFNFNSLSERFQEITGLDPKKIIGQPRWNFSGDSLPSIEWPRHIQELKNHQSFRDFRYSVPRGDGTFLHASISGVPLFDERGNFKGYRGAGRDISKELQAAEQTKRMEEQLLQAQKMEAIGQLTGGIAHDFNNILAVILGNIELAQERLDEKSDLSKFMQSVEKSAVRGAELTQRLLAYSRKQELRPVSVQINDFVEGILALVDRLLGETITIHQEFLSGVPPVVADPSQLENAIVNLCINSRDAMQSGGTLYIKTGTLSISASNSSEYSELAPGNYSWLSIQDTGIGMTEETLAHVFEPFFTTKEVGKGTGLGLSMVYGFAHQSNGTVKLESKEGEGTTAIIILPNTTAG